MSMAVEGADLRGPCVVHGWFRGGSQPPVVAIRQAELAVLAEQQVISTVGSLETWTKH